MFQLRSSCFMFPSELSFLPFVSPFRFSLSFLPFVSPFSVESPNERVTSRDNDILLYSPARCLAISPTKCHPRLRRAVQREAYENVIPSSQSPYRAIPANVVSHFSSSLRFSLGLFSGAVAYVSRRYAAGMMHLASQKRQKINGGKVSDICLRWIKQPIDRALTCGLL